MILERNMPVMDGLQFLQAVKAATCVRSVPTLLVGRAIAADDVRTGVLLGVRDVLAKPFSGAAVIDRLGRMLRKGVAPSESKQVVFLSA
jgi:DNA-binding response OmpR family regulator